MSREILGLSGDSVAHFLDEKSPLQSLPAKIPIEAKSPGHRHQNKKAVASWCWDFFCVGLKRKDDPRREESGVTGGEFWDVRSERLCTKYLKEQEEDYYKPESDLLVPGENETSEALKDYKAKNIGRNPVKELEETDDDENEERIEDVVLEARFVAKQIQKLLQSDYHVFDKKERLSKN